MSKKPLKIAAIVVLVLSALLTGVAFLPCIGWLNWVAAPFTGVPVVVGIIGLASDREKDEEDTTGPAPYLAALIGGVVLFGISVVRCLLGGGVA